jgi:hypothetical protein
MGKRKLIDGLIARAIGQDTPKGRSKAYGLKNSFKKKALPALPSASIKAGAVKRGRYAESELQEACVNYFRYMYPAYSRRLFAIPNGGHRHPATAQRLKREGVLPGIPDLLLALPRLHYGGLFIEVKAGKAGKLSPLQVEAIKELENDYKIVVVRSFEDFQKAIKDYLI